MIELQRTLLIQLGFIASLLSACGGGASPEDSDPAGSDPKGSDPKGSDPESPGPESARPGNSTPESAGPGSTNPVGVADNGTTSPLAPTPDAEGDDSSPSVAPLPPGTDPTSEPEVPISAAANLPCDVQSIVYSRCAQCHSDPPVSTYMPLLTHDDFHDAATTDPSQANWELAAERILSTTDPMPPRDAAPLTAEEKDTLSAWFEAGAPASDDVCEAVELPDAPAPVVDADIDTTGLTCYEFLAHAPGDRNAKFPVGVATDAYYNMTFQAPWQGTGYGTIVRPIIDNGPVLHHWLFYYQPGGTDGEVVVSNGQHSGGELIHGWAPGGAALNLQKHGDVAFELLEGTYLIEFHYNSADPDAVDASGLEVCLRPDKPPNIAGLSWLGLDHGAESYLAGALFGTAASGACVAPSDLWEGTCRPAAQTEPINLLFVVPHMHQAGVHMKSVINGPNGTRVLHDDEFVFDSQKGYDVTEVLMPGESITTTCTYSEPKCSGQSTEAEMCYLFTYAYPKGALADNGAWGSLAHGSGACLGQ